MCPVGRPYGERHIRERDRKRLNSAIAVVEEVLGATLWAFLATDDQGTFVHARPDCELQVFDFMAAVDWKLARMFAGEVTK